MNTQQFNNNQLGNVFSSQRIDKEQRQNWKEQTQTNILMKPSYQLQEPSNNDRLMANNQETQQILGGKVQGFGARKIVQQNSGIAGGPTPPNQYMMDFNMKI